jgi:Domain of unknown function (DUF5655)
MPMTSPHHRVEDHFVNRPPALRAAYDALLDASRRLGPVKVEPKKTSIHLVRTTAFAGVAVRKAALVLTVKAAKDIRSPRIARHERASANRWHLETRVDGPDNVDAELIAWLTQAYELAE